MNTQLSLLGEQEAKVNPDDEKTIVRLGKHSAAIRRNQKRRIALNRLMELLQKWEGKDIFISSYSAGGNHYWVHDLKLGRLQLEYYPMRFRDDTYYIPETVVLWGSRGACVRIFTKYVEQLREQEYQGYWLYLLDFRNGFYEAPLDDFRSHYTCLQITRFKD